MKKADNSGAALALIIGPDELAQGVVQLKNLRAQAPQEAVSMDRLVDVVIERLVSLDD
jgi:histidyl-tRNA synthetase